MTSADPISIRSKATPRRADVWANFSGIIGGQLACTNNLLVILTSAGLRHPCPIGLLTAWGRKSP